MQSERQVRHACKIKRKAIQGWTLLHWKDGFKKKIDSRCCHIYDLRSGMSHAAGFLTGVFIC